MLELNMQGVFRKIRKIQNISYFQFTICPMDPNGSIRGCYLVASRGKGAVCKDHAVAAEIVVVGHFSRKIAAVAQGAVLPYAVVTPFPDAPADKMGVAIDPLPVIPYIAGAVAHGVGVFTEENGTDDLRAFRQFIQNGE